MITITTRITINFISFLHSLPRNYLKHCIQNSLILNLNSRKLISKHLTNPIK